MQAAPGARIFTAMAKPPPPKEDDFVAALRRHGQLIETDDPDAPLPEGVTHVLVPGPRGRKLVEKRKSAF